MILGSILVTGVFILTLYLWKVSRRPKNFPPGPTRYPFLGSIPFLISKQRDEYGNVVKLNPLLRLLDQFGNIVGFFLGPDPAVICSDYETVKNLLKMEEMTGRQYTFPVNELRPGWEVLNGTDNEGHDPGVIMTEGKWWKEQRRFLLRHLKDFGFGKSSMEESILEEAQKLVNEVSKLVGKPTTLAIIVNISVFNALWVILVGEKLEFNDPHTRKVVDGVNTLIRDVPKVRPPISYFLPSYGMLRWKIFEPFTKRSFFVKIYKGIYDILSPILDRHMKNHDPNDIQDFMDLMIKECNETKDPGSSFHKEKGISFLINDLIDLFIAGMETTSSSLIWTFLYMLHHPDIKRRVQDELEQVYGENDPSLALRPRCHYTNAVLLESLRLTGLVPFSVPHKAMEKVTIGKYVIPKGTLIFPCLQRIMRDPSHFRDANKFIPDRFMDADGKFRSDERVIPFSIGKRYCLGQSLAEKEYFLFFTMIMKKLDMNPVPGECLPSYEIGEMKVDRFIRVPPEFKMIFSKR